MWVWFCPSQVYTVDKKLEHSRASLKLRSNKGLSWEAGSSQRQKGRDFAESTNNNLLYCSTICPITCENISAKQKLPNSWCLLQFLQGGKHLKSFGGRCNWFNVSKMYLKSIWNVLNMYLKCIWDEFEMYLKCIKVIWRLIKLLLNVSAMNLETDVRTGFSSYRNTWDWAFWYFL